MSDESSMERALYVNASDELVLDLKAFVAAIAKAATHKPRRVHIGSCARRAMRAMHARLLK